MKLGIKLGTCMLVLIVLGATVKWVDPSEVLHVQSQSLYRNNSFGSVAMLYVVENEVGCAPRTLRKQRVHSCIGAPSVI